MSAYSYALCPASISGLDGPSGTRLDAQTGVLSKARLRLVRSRTSISPDLVSLRPCWRLILADKGKELQPKAVIEADYKRKRHEEEIRTGERSGIELI